MTISRFTLLTLLSALLLCACTTTTTTSRPSTLGGLKPDNRPSGFVELVYDLDAQTFTMLNIDEPPFTTKDMLKVLKDLKITTDQELRVNLHTLDNTPLISEISILLSNAGYSRYVFCTDKVAESKRLGRLGNADAMDDVSFPQSKPPRVIDKTRGNLNRPKR